WRSFHRRTHCTGKANFGRCEDLAVNCRINGRRVDSADGRPRWAAARDKLRENAARLEQKIRAERMARLRVFKMIDPAELTPLTLIEAVATEIDAARTCPLAPARIQLDALPRISGCVAYTLTEQKMFGHRSFAAGHAR